MAPSNGYSGYTCPIYKKRANLSFGSYPAISLKTARELRRENETLIAEGKNPAFEKQEQKARRQEHHNNSLECIDQEWLDFKSSRVTKAHIKDIKRSLELHVFPRLGQRPIASISPK